MNVPPEVFYRLQTEVPDKVLQDSEISEIADPRLSLEAIIRSHGDIARFSRPCHLTSVFADIRRSYGI